MLENKKSIPARTLSVLSNDGNIQKLKIGQEKLVLDIKISPSPTSNCQLSSINNINDVIDILTIEELTYYIKNIILPGNYIKLIIIRNKSRLNKFKKSFELVKNRRIHIEQETKIKGIYQYIILLKTK